MESRFNINYAVARYKNGLRKILQPSLSTLVLIAYIVLFIVFWVKTTNSMESSVFGQSAIAGLSSRLSIFAGIIFMSFIPFLVGAPLCSIRINFLMERTGLVNKEGESPLLINAVQLDDYMEYEFFSCGIPLKQWYDKKPELEAALNMEIGEIQYSSGKWLIKISSVSAEAGLINRINWNNYMLKEKDFVLNLGKSVMGDVLIDLNKIPHMLLGGSTGSGKSVLLKCLVHQCIMKDARVVIADFKGGVDYSSYFKSKCDFVTDIDRLICLLKEVVEELQDRKELFEEIEVSNLPEYNYWKIPELRRERIIIAFDEVAEVLDATGASKENKAKINTVVELLSTIARQGRAFGINLILSMQRPDANILPGQIRNNIDGRYCGRADDVLSKIILDNTLASDIPKYEQGMFVAQNGTVFRAYYFEDNYNTGRYVWKDC